MTDDFKQKLADYITNNVTKTNPGPKTQFDDVIEMNINKWIGVLPKYLSIELKGSIIDNISNKVIIYGNYAPATSSSVPRGIIIVLDDTFTPIKAFSSYSNGAALNPIQCMKQAEDGTYYLIDKTTNLRLIMVNNFSKINSNGEYVLDFRKSYNFDSSFNDYKVKDMFKSGTSAHYVFFSDYETNIKATELKVNVGEANEWNTITITGNYFGGAFALFNDENVFWRILTYNGGLINNIRCYTKDYTQTSTTVTSIANVATDLKIEGKNKCVFLDKNNIYYVLKGESYIGFDKYSFDDNTQKTIYSKNLLFFNYDENISLTITNATVYVQYITNIINIDLTGDYCWQRLIDDVWNPVQYATNKLFKEEWVLLISKTDFNLTQICSLLLPRFYEPPELVEMYFILIGKDNYNTLNYNGVPYTDYNSMISKQVEIYSNNSLVFARNIIDKTIVDNKTISNVIVPNTYLNNIVLDKENLLSETNNAIVSSNSSITKNVYEAIYLNFVNNITSKGILEDSGEATNLTINSDINSYITENINIGTEENCQDTSMGWLVVNYSDGTTMTNSINWELDNSDEYKYKYTFALDVQKEITSYAIKSYDMQKTYYTAINNTYPTQLEVGNVYTITQSVSVS